jgi:hypothetical protein
LLEAITDKAGLEAKKTGGLDIGSETTALNHRK